MRYLKLILSFASYSTKKELTYRLNTFLSILFSIIWVFTTYLVISLIYTQAGSVAGWKKSEAVLLMIVYYVTSTLVRSWIIPNVIDFVENIRKGELDFILLKPIDAQFIISFRKIHLMRSIRAFLMVPVFIYFVQSHGIQITLFQFSLASVLGILGILGIYSLYLTLSLLAFKFENLWNIDELLFGFFEMAKQPLNLYQGPIRFAILYIIPIAGLAAIPTLVLLNIIDWPLIISFVLSIGGSLILSRFLLFRAFRSYTGASG